MNQEQAGQMQNLFEEMGQKFQEEANKTQQNEYLNKKRANPIDQNQNITNENNDENNSYNSEEEIIDLNSQRGNKQEKNNENEYEKNENDSSSNDKVKEMKFNFGAGENFEIKEIRHGFSLETVACGLVIRFKTFKLPRHAKATMKYIKDNERFLNNMTGTAPRKVWINNLFNLIKNGMVEN